MKTTLSNSHLDDLVEQFTPADYADKPELEFYMRLTDLGKRRIFFDVVKSEFAKTCKWYQIEETNERLCDFLQTLAIADLIYIPSCRDSHGRLLAVKELAPEWIVLSRPALKCPSVLPESFEWVPELAFCKNIMRTSKIRFALAINNFLLHHPAPLTVVPCRERSLQIFGDEKLLEQYIYNGSIFGGKLSLETIGVIELPEQPLHEKSGVLGLPVLIVENWTTYWSLCKWNARTKKYSGIVYGKGAGFVRWGRSVGMLLTELEAEKLEFFGDIDFAGLEMPVSFNKLQEQSGGISIEPALSFYQWLLSKGIRRTMKPSIFARSLCETIWLPQDLHDEVVELFASRLWLPQEGLGTEALAAYF